MNDVVSREKNVHDKRVDYKMRAYCRLSGLPWIGVAKDVGLYIIKCV